MVCYCRPTVYAYVPNFVSIGLFCQFILLPSGGENPQFLPYFRLQHSVVSPVGSNLRKFNTVAQLQTLPYPIVSKSFLYSNAYMAKSCAQTLTFTSVRDRQTDKTDRQKTQRFWPPLSTELERRADPLRQLNLLLWPPCVIGQAIIFLPCRFFLLLLLFFLA